MARKLSKKNKNKKQKIVKKPKKRSKSRHNQDRNSKLNYPTGKYTEAVGRRKTAVARVRIYPSKGDFIVNDKLATDYFTNINKAEVTYNKPFILTGVGNKFSVTAQVKGSGISAQLDAVVHGLSRALVKYDGEFRSLLKKENLLTRDDRMKETRKIGRGGKARRKRQSPKR